MSSPFVYFSTARCYYQTSTRYFLETMLIGGDIGLQSQYMPS